MSQVSAHEATVVLNNFRVLSLHSPRKSLHIRAYHHPKRVQRTESAVKLRQGSNPEFCKDALPTTPVALARKVLTPLV